MDVRLILFCIFFYGIATFFRKLAVDQIHPFQFEIISGSLHAALVPIFLWLTTHRGISAPITLPSVGWVFLCTACQVAAAVVFGFMIRGSSNTGVLTALVSLSPIVTLALSVGFLNESFSLWKVVAFILALASAIVVNF